MGRQGYVFLVLGVVVIVGGYILFGRQIIQPQTYVSHSFDEGGPGEQELHPLTIAAQRQKEYPGSEIVIEQTLSPGSNYQRYIVSYRSEGLKIYALLTVPNGEVPLGGWPAIVFNHGYIPPAEYATGEKYVVYVDGFAREGYAVFKPDYRGHGESEGNPSGAYYSDAYITDVLNAVASIKESQSPSTLRSNSGRAGSGRFVDPNRIGMWGHSMGGHLTLRAMVVTSDIKAGVIWAGVVGSYEDMINNWRRRIPWVPSTSERQFRRPGRQELIDQYGIPEQNQEFWQSISPINFVSDISGPIALHHGTSDESVPWEFSQSLSDALVTAGKTVEYYTYPGADHNLSGGAFSQAMNRSVEFFDKYFK